METPQIITLGEALVEVMRTSAGTPLDVTGIFSGPYASGAPAIFAVAAARLGMKTGFLGSVGSDAFGRLLRSRLNLEGVDTRHIQEPQGYASGVAFVAYADDGSREFVFHIRHAAAGVFQPEQMDQAYFANTRWLHISGSTIALNEGWHQACLQALAWVKDAGGRLSFDPNLRPELMPVEAARRAFQPFLETADLVLPTTSEAAALTGETREEAACRILAGGGKRVVVLKKGSQGCTIYAAGELIHVPGVQVEEVDPTGAGDCFNAACIYGLSQDWSMDQVGRFAAAAGALAVTRLGPMEGAPYLKEVDISPTFP
jgi:sugar/nucleoside kinase (ribokinase family)